MNEVWKDIPGYEGSYQASNLGNIKSLSRIILRHGKYPFTSKEKILKPTIDSHRYPRVLLFKNSKQSYIRVHKLIAMAFLNHKPCGYKLVVDHINNNRLDNRLDNLQIITARENCSKDTKGSSKYTGVYWDKERNIWRSMIQINGKSVFLGRYKCELKAAEAYINKLKEIQNV